MMNIAAPRPDRPPLRVNIFSAMQRANTKLMPLFPYLHPGAMVPCASLIIGNEKGSHGQFFHSNSEDEVVLFWVTRGGTMAAGQVFVGGRTHGVNSFLKNEKDPQSFGINCVTQRQPEGRKQTEAYTLKCFKCRTDVFHREFDTTPPPDARELTHPFPTIVAAAETFAVYNADASLRTCPKCGHVNEPFPVAEWGWDKYAAQSARTTLALSDIGVSQGAA